ncbi:DUF1269 domain-containing protein [Desulfofalx alkaliphila]|uniref:DUF1269 domain-containing protein n=1 Tax=Desulfofalx alkaliphila TaxID=105483 RepID=UPI0004E1FE87|nr:DUF1269 domain-containing protein [Desulfofalx alkaliphila]
MSKTVVGMFPNRQEAERAVEELRSQGFEREISVLAKEEEGGGGGGTQMRGDGVGDGVATGGVLGGIAGLAAGAGALAIPGIGPLLAVGPIAGMLSGAAAGGVAGGLVDFGIPEEEGRRYEEKIKQGHTMVAVQTSDSRINQAAETMRRHRGQDVKVH